MEFFVIELELEPEPELSLEPGPEKLLYTGL